MTRVPWRDFAILAAIFCVVAFVVFAPALSGPFVFDDSYQFFAAPNLPNTPPSTYLFGARPVIQISYYLNHLANGASPAGFRTVDFLLHGVNSALVALVVHLLIGGTGSSQLRTRLAATLAGVLFLVHPIQSEAVIYISARSDLLCSFFFLLGLILFLYFREREIGWGISLAITLLFLLALGSKEIAIAFPAVLLTYEWIFRKREPGLRASGAWRLYGLLGAGALAGVAMVLRYIGGGTGVALRPDLPYFFTQWRSLFTYLQLLVWPSPLNVDRDFPLSATLLDHGALWYLLALLAAAGVAIWKRDRGGLVIFGLLAALFVLAPTSSFLPIQDPIAERRMYLPMAGISIIVAAAILRARWADRHLWIAGLALGAVYAFVSYQRADVWSTAVNLWEDTVAKSPNKFRPRFWLGQSYLSAGRCPDAIRELARAADLAPKDDPELHFFRASAFGCNRQFQEAAAEMSKSIALKGPNAQSLAFRATYYASAGDLAKAHEDLDDALSRNPNSVPALSTRGRLFLAERRYAESVADLERAVRLYPQDASLTIALDEARRMLRASQP